MDGAGGAVKWVKMVNREALTLESVEGIAKSSIMWTRVVPAL